MFASRALLGLTLFVALESASVAQDARPTPPTGTLSTKEWLAFSTDPLAPGEIDRLVDAELAKVGLKPAPRTTDEQFVRRAYLDVTGKMPSPSDLRSFANDTRPDKRVRLIDALLDTDDYAQHWGRYWRDVVTSRSTDLRSRLSAGHFERWLIKQFQANASWAQITKEILTATGEIKQDAPDVNGQAYFLMSRTGADARTELAAEASRIFLGIQIQCAQCHDHPSDVWKREQFHQFAAYFARVRERPIREEMRIVGQQLVSLPFGEHQMPDTENPRKTTTVRPRFLDGAAPSGFLSDQNRRRSLADSTVSKSNPWFAGAFVNRMWGAFMGQAFYQPIDDLGPEKVATMPGVIGRVAGAFRGSDYDIKQLIRAILISETYQRQTRPGESSEDHLLFGANNPTRLPADMLWNSLVNAIGPIQSTPRFFMKGPAFGGPFGRFAGSIENQFKQEFAFDASTKAEDIEGSISQALILMNNPVINQRIRAGGGSVLGRILSTYTGDDEAIGAVYLKTLARRPTDRELDRCQKYIREASSRTEAYEDILWVLINSTEFQTRR